VRLLATPSERKRRLRHLTIFSELSPGSFTRVTGPSSSGAHVRTDLRSRTIPGGERGQRVIWRDDLPVVPNIIQGGGSLNLCASKGDSRKFAASTVTGSFILGLDDAFALS
jgi:hypothetical protein